VSMVAVQRVADTSQSLQNAISLDRFKAGNCVSRLRSVADRCMLLL
jgi:hypothetical protein